MDLFFLNLIVCASYLQGNEVDNDSPIIPVLLRGSFASYRPDDQLIRPIMFE
jgi:hypothetical protein